MQCEQKDCTNEATVAWIWPGDRLRASCEHHYQVAQRVANALGFFLSRLHVLGREIEVGLSVRKQLRKGLGQLPGEAEEEAMEAKQIAEALGKKM